VSNPIDAGLAGAVGAAAARPGPRVSAIEAADAVAALRAASRQAIAYVAEVTGLGAAADAAAQVPVRVVDRRGFARANAQMVQIMARDTIDASRAEAIATSIETGLVLAYLSSRVLGQFDPFAPPPADAAHDGLGQVAEPSPSAPAGRLLLVAPNVVRFERELDLPPSDFRLWVTLHEMTHAVLFAAAPWIARRLVADLGDLLASEAGTGAPVDGPRLARTLVQAVRGKGGTNLARDVLSPPAQEVMDRITAVMSLLEGHADVVMDAVGPLVIPSLTQIRSRFDARRRGKPGPDRMARRLLGMEAKTAQYIDGAAFVRGVIEAAGHAGIAAAFGTEANLPTPAEIADPAAWVARVLG
jgi:coenzyme F420 biosynthesis associated uncharacterized protein